MDSKFSSSFIPKASYGEANEENQGYGIFAGVAILVFILSILITGGLFFYKMRLKSEADNLKSQLATASTAIDMKAIGEILAFEKRMVSIKEILRNHTAASQYLGMIEKNTVSRVQFTNLKYDFASSNNLKVEMGGKAASLAVIALQEDAFLKNEHAINIAFSNMRTDKKTGAVSFTFKGEFKSDLIKFKLPEGLVSEAEEPLEDLGTLPDLNDI